MLMKLQTFASLYRELGFRWSVFRLVYAFRLRTGLIRLQMPQYRWNDRPLETWLKKDISSNPESYTQWRKQNSPKFFFGSLRAERSERLSSADEARLPSTLPWNKQTAIDEANRILSGEIRYFAHQFHQTGFPPNWQQDYFSSYVTLSDSEGSLHQPSETLRSLSALPQSDISTKHWSQISDDANIDIKFIWEANRFSFVYTLVRAYAASQDEKYAEAFWQLILDWAEHNPPNTGANWKDGQEIVLRLMAWMFGYYQFSNSPSATPQHIARFTTFVAAQAERIYKNIDYAISTKSNHTISEAFGLWLVGLLFPELKDAEKYLALGKKLLEEEAVKQIFHDGSYSMYSLNYHRFILQIYLYMIRLGELNQSPVSSLVYQKTSSSITYLSQLIDPQTGQMPVYGSNDGALVLPLNNCDFTDYRPLLQLGSFITKGESLFDSGEWDEDIFWLYGTSPLSQRETAKRSEGEVRVRESQDSTSFLNGGVFLLRGANSKALIRCTDFRSRPSHADQLHVDLWIHGHNIACDAGTYLYSGKGIWRNGFARTSVHNTVTVDGKDQMTMFSRFTWTNWAKGKVLKHNEKIWQGEHNGYKPVAHKRTVMILEDDRWLVIDNLIANEPHRYALHWLLCDGDFGVQELATAHGLWLTPAKTDSKLSDSKILIEMGLMEGNENFSIVRADPNSTRGWRSRYYGHKEPAISVMLEANQSQVTFWTFFGFENDVVEVEENDLKINSNKIPLVERKQSKPTGIKNTLVTKVALLTGGFDTPFATPALACGASVASGYSTTSPSNLQSLILRFLHNYHLLRSIPVGPITTPSLPPLPPSTSPSF
ncbi:MAG: heparinase II/III family protein [Anaerolineae bacterium]|nr:heparinase II/III family protein [Anaerolineae bacterium]